MTHNLIPKPFMRLWRVRSLLGLWLKRSINQSWETERRLVVLYPVLGDEERQESDEERQASDVGGSGGAH